MKKKPAARPGGMWQQKEMAAQYLHMNGKQSLLTAC
jgi:hypothetical protein